MVDRLTKKEDVTQGALDFLYQKNGCYPSRRELKKLNLVTPTKDLYFLRCSETNRIKIGVANNVKNRFSGIQVGSPTKLKIDLVVEYGEKLEKFLHNKFLSYRVKGEWFSSNEELESIIADFRKIICLQ